MFFQTASYAGRCLSRVAFCLCLFGVVEAAFAQAKGVPRRASVQECRDQAAHINDVAQQWDPPSPDQKRYMDEKLRDYERCCTPNADTQCVLPWRSWPKR